MTTPIEVIRSKLPGDMAHMIPAQSSDPKEYRQVQRRKKDNVSRDLLGNVNWYEDSCQPEPGYIIWRVDKKGQQVIAHIEYIETEDAWFGLHYVKGIPYATIGSKINKGKYSLKRKGGKTPNLYLWRNDLEPLSEEETPSEVPTILQMAQASPTPGDLETIIQGLAAIPVQNQLMDDEEPLEYFDTALTRGILPIPPAPIQINMAKAQKGMDEDEETKAAKGSLKGSPPTKFDGDRKMAKKFLNDFKTYKFLNRKNETMKIPANRIALALTFIKGEHVQDWAHEVMKNMEDRLDSTLNPMLETNEYHWDYFEDAFRDAFTDTSEREDADNKLQNLHMKDGNLDQFIAEFNQLTHLADWNDETRGLIPLFHQGLPYGLAQACMNRSKWLETIHQWQAAAREENKQYTIKKNLGLARSPKDGKERKQQWKAALKNKARDNSVPMEVDATQTRRPLTKHQEKLKKEGRCFHCEAQGHMSRECPKKTNKLPPYTKAQVVATQPTATTSTEAATTQTEMDEEKVNRLVAELKGLNDDVQDKVLNGAFIGQEDF